MSQPIPDIPDDRTVQQNRYVLGLNSVDDGYAAYDRGDGTTLGVYLSPEDYEDLGSPQTISVIVIPGDILSPRT